MIKLFEQGRCVKEFGLGVVVRGGDGQEINPNWVTKTRGDEVGGFEIRSPSDSRLISNLAANGAYEIRAARADGTAVIKITFYMSTGGSAEVFSGSMNANQIRDMNVVDAKLPISNPVIHGNIIEAIKVAVLRSYCKEPADFSLEPAKPVDVAQTQLAARSRVGLATYKKENAHGWNRANRTVAV